MLKLQIGCLCDNAFLSMDGKMNIIGEFNALHFQRKYQDLKFVANFFIVSAYLSDMPGEFQQIIRFVRTDGEQPGLKIMPDNTTAFTIKREKGYVIVKQTVEFSDFGRYEAHLITDGPSSEPIVKIPLIIQEYKPQPKPVQ